MRKKGRGADQKCWQEEICEQFVNVQVITHVCAQVGSFQDAIA
jgi:hypothetical protein